MDHIAFMDYLRTRGEPADVVPRVYPSIRGTDQVIFLTQGYWDYVDWLEARGVIDFAAWVKHCETHPFEGMTLSHLLMHWLWTDECNRHRNGDETPTNAPPEGFERWGTAANDT